MTARGLVVAVATLVTAAAVPAQAQSFDPKPWGRVSFFTNTSRAKTVGMPTRSFDEVTLAVTVTYPDLENDGFEYGLDMRRSNYYLNPRPDRLALYEAFIGKRLAKGKIKARVGHVWLNDLGALGAVAGFVVEARQPRSLPSQGRVRGGLFAGLEPNTLDAGYAKQVRKGGAYLAYDADRGRRHVVGLVVVRNASLNERSVVTATNFIPLKQKVWIYQASEYDVSRPSGQGKSGLAYFFSNVRYSPVGRVDLQGTYNRGRSIDTRSLSDDILNGRPLTEATLAGLLYESAGGRVTVEVIRRVRVYGGYSRDKNNRETAATGRVLYGGYASNVANTGFDLAASDSLIDRPTGRYHSRYASLGRQLGRRIYATVDFSTSLAVVRYNGTDGISVELRPHTVRYSGSANITLTRVLALIASAERTVDGDTQYFRLMSGLTYRFK